MALIFLLASCRSSSKPLPYVNLSQRQALPAIAKTEVLPLRVAVAAIISPQGTVESYSELADYLAKKLGRPAQLIQRRTYAEINSLIAEGEVDIAFVCTGAYVDGQKRFGMELLAAPEIDGKHVYYSELIVALNNPATSMRDLRGAVFAFTDPMSYSGRVYPSYLVQQLDETPETFFNRSFFTYSHDKAILAVAEGVADGAAVDSLVLANSLQKNPELKEKIKVIYRSPPFGIPPVVVPPNMSARQKALLQEALLEMSSNPEGQRILANLGIDRFVTVSDSIYDTARAVVSSLGGIP